MIRTFLKAKHWQLFLITFGLPLIMQIFMVIKVFSRVISQDNEPDTSLPFNIFIWLILISLIVGFVNFGWQWSVSTGLQKFIPSDIKMKTTRFKLFFLIPITYLLAVIFIMTMFILGISSNEGLSSVEPTNSIFTTMFMVVPLHLFAVFCIFYIMYFTAKTIKTVELQKEARFSDCAGEFFMIWFNFIGYWILQPRVNRIIEGSEIPD